MADEMDLVQQRELEERERYIRRGRAAACCYRRG